VLKSHQIILKGVAAMHANKKIILSSVFALSFALTGCGEDSYEFVNADLDDMREVKTYLYENMDLKSGYLYDVETDAVSFISYDDWTGSKLTGSKLNEPRYFVKSYSADKDLKLQFEAYAGDLLSEMRERAKQVVDQDNVPMTKYLFFALSGSGSDLTKDAVSIEMIDPFGKIKCYANGADPIERVLQEEDDENDIERKVEYDLMGNCIADLSAQSKPEPSAAPKNSMNN
jgi:hypothetical protein